MAEKRTIQVPRNTVLIVTPLTGDMRPHRVPAQTTFKTAAIIDRNSNTAEWSDSRYQYTALLSEVILL